MQNEITRNITGFHLEDGRWFCSKCGMPVNVAYDEDFNIIRLRCRLGCLNTWRIEDVDSVSGVCQCGKSEDSGRCGEGKCKDCPNDLQSTD